MSVASVDGCCQCALAGVPLVAVALSKICSFALIRRFEALRYRTRKVSWNQRQLCFLISCLVDDCDESARMPGAEEGVADVAWPGRRLRQ